MQRFHVIVNYIFYYYLFKLRVSNFFKLFSEPTLWANKVHIYRPLDDSKISDRNFVLVHRLCVTALSSHTQTCQKHVILEN